MVCARQRTRRLFSGWLKPPRTLLVRIYSSSVTCCHLEKDTEVFTAITPDYRADSFPRLSDSVQFCCTTRVLSWIPQNFQNKTVHIDVCGLGLGPVMAALILERCVAGEFVSCCKHERQLHSPPLTWGGGINLKAYANITRMICMARYQKMNCKGTFFKWFGV